MNPTTIVCKGDGHRSLFEGSPSECGGGAATASYGLNSKRHSRNKIHAQGRNALPLIRT